MNYVTYFIERKIQEKGLITVSALFAGTPQKSVGLKTRRSAYQEAG